MISDRTATIIIGVITVVWTANIVAGMFLKGYDTDPAINGIFTLIVGGAFALRHSALSKDGRGGDPK